MRQDMRENREYDKGEDGFNGLVFHQSDGDSIISFCSPTIVENLMSMTSDSSWKRQQPSTLIYSGFFYVANDNVVKFGFPLTMEGRQLERQRPRKTSIVSSWQSHLEQRDAEGQACKQTTCALKHQGFLLLTMNGELEQQDSEHRLVPVQAYNLIIVRRVASLRQEFGSLPSDFPQR
ncbi:hypothetical protein C8R42DRAFT_717192 [Lentinula raphanica]|nr:hypothetical protein C8R42DRAFT_717192 [Lentinula raphanica]